MQQARRAQLCIIPDTYIMVFLILYVIVIPYSQNFTLLLYGMDRGHESQETEQNCTGLAMMHCVGPNETDAAE